MTEKYKAGTPIVRSAGGERLARPAKPESPPEPSLVMSDVPLRHQEDMARDALAEQLARMVHELVEEEGLPHPTHLSARFPFHALWYKDAKRILGLVQDIRCPLELALEDGQPPCPSPVRFRTETRADAERLALVVADHLRVKKEGGEL